MPKFDIELLHTVTERLMIEVSAKDDDAAQAKVDKVLEDGPTRDDLAKKFKADWELDEEEITVDSVEEQ